MLVPAATDGALRWFELRADDLTRVAVPTIDQTRQLANLDFADTPAVAIEAAEPQAVLARTVNVLITALEACAMNPDVPKFNPGVLQT